MKLSLPGHFGGFLLITGMVVTGSVLTSESVLRWLTATTLDLKSISRHSSRTVSWSTDGRTLLTRARGGEATASTIAIFDLTNPSKPRRLLNDLFGVSTYGATLSPDGRNVLTATEQGQLCWIDLASQNVSGVAESVANPFASTAVSHDCRLVVGATIHGEICLFPLDQSRPVVLVSSNRTSVSQLSFSKDDDRLLAIRSDGSIEIWDVITHVQLRVVSGQSLKTAAAFLPDGSKVISTEKDCIQIWDVATGNVEWSEPHGMEGTFRACHLDISSDGSLVVWGSITQRIVIWDLQLSCKRFDFDHPAIVLDVSFSPDGKTLAVTGMEHLIRIYDTMTGRETIQIDTSLPSGV